MCGHRRLSRVSMTSTRKVPCTGCRSSALADQSCGLFDTKTQTASLQSGRPDHLCQAPGRSPTDDTADRGGTERAESGLPGGEARGPASGVRIRTERG